MRIMSEERNAIINAVRERDPLARTLLFGSRVDDRKRGGDIDILIISNCIERNELGEIQDDVFEHIEEQKLDLVLTNSSIDDAFARFIIAREETIEL